MTDQEAKQEQLLAGVFQQMGQALASSLDLRNLLGLVVDQAMAFLDADVAILRLLDQPGEYLEVEVSRGVPDEVVRQIRFRLGEGLAGRLLLDGTPLRGINLQQDPRAQYRAVARRFGWQSFAAVALHLHRQPIGVWFMIRKRRQPFTERDLALLSAFADYASVGIERTWLLQTIVQGKHESETLLQASANGILVVDGGGRIIELNPALERLTGWTAREARGQSCRDVVGCQLERTGEEPEPSPCPLEIGERGKDKGFLEYQIHTRDGHSLPVEASYGLIRANEGQADRIVMVFRDISRQREMEHMRAEIIANVSHELRTPLALIKGYATTLLSPTVILDEAETRRFLSNVSSAADGLGRMIDDLLCASRLETDQLLLRPQRFDLNHQVHQVLTWFQPHAQKRNLIADLPDDGLQVWADPDRVEQVLVNLLTNAAKYSPSDSTITIQARSLGEPPRVVVHVSDDGIGIAREHLPHIFDRFYLTEDSKRGVGLGLYICKGLVEAMGGEIWVVSEVGAGSTFSFSLPAKADAAAAVAVYSV
jgi:PAS domain S-box-containing protein